MKAIHTQLLQATSSKPARIRVDAPGVRRIILSLNMLQQELEQEGKTPTTCAIHTHAALSMCSLRGWPFDLRSGELPDGSWAHCLA